MRRSVLTSLMALSVLGLSVQAAEVGVAPNGVKLTKYIIGVADLEKSYAFYHALGFELQRPGPVGKPALLNDTIRKLVDVPAGAKFRNTMMNIPGADFAFETTEFSGMTLQPGKPRVFDAGASLLILTVRDINVALDAAKKQGGEVVTVGGVPVGIGPNNSTKAVFVKDPDSFYVEFLQPATLPATTAPASSNVIGARFGSTVENAEKAAQFYREHFGLEVNVGAWTTDETLLKLAGLTRGQRRNATVTVPGSALTWTFFEFKTEGTKAFALRIPDPGAPAIGFQVRNLLTATSDIKAKGGSVITVDGQMKMPTGDAIAFTRDPNGVLVEFAETAKK